MIIIIVVKNIEKLLLLITNLQYFFDIYRNNKTQSGITISITNNTNTNTINY